jgi:hypothetical protein
MLIHATLRHSSDNCPGFDPELRAKLMEAYPKIDDVAAKYGVTIRDLYNAAPDHVEFMVVDTPDNMSLALFLAEALPYRVDYETHVVSDRASLRELLERMS